MRRAADEREHGDAPMAPAHLAPYLDDLDRLNRWFGGYRLASRTVQAVLATRGRGAAVVVDVGGARGDFAQRLVRDARAVRRAIVVVVADRDEASLGMGARAAKDYPELRWVQADATALPFRAASVAVAVTSLTMHHLEPDAAVQALREMRSIARLGVVVNDLLRSWASFAGVWLSTRLFARHPSSRHDGPLSVRRAYAAAELHALARRAGFRSFHVRRYWPFLRLIAVGT